MAFPRLDRLRCLEFESRGSDLQRELNALVLVDASRVVAECMSVHSASRRVMEKAGMRLVRAFHADWPYAIPGDELGDVEYAIDRGGWEKMTANGTDGDARLPHATAEEA